MHWHYNDAYHCYCSDEIVYCKKPKDPKKQSLKIYVPEVFMRHDGTITWDKNVLNHNGSSYTAKTVPIIYVNGVSGYRESAPPEVADRTIKFIKDGYVTIGVGSRGKETRDASGKSIGKAPAALVDLKAGIRWLRAHKGEFPGDTDKIVSVGRSAGGAMSSMVGLTGDHPDYDVYLEEIGAEMDESDRVYASQCFCPITNLENADMAYEWMFREKAISVFNSSSLPKVNSEFQRALSHDLADAFPEYINSLDLGLTLNRDGRSGSYYNAVMAEITKSLNRFLIRHGHTQEERKLLAEEVDAGTGTVMWTGKDWEITDLDAYVHHIIGRKKACPAFDALEKHTHENHVFGFETEDYMHFDSFIGTLMSDGRYEKLNGYSSIYAEDYSSVTKDVDLLKRISLINPMNYIKLCGTKHVAEHFRIRVGSMDADTSFGIAFTLAKALEAAGHQDVDYALVWGLGHCDADYPGEFSTWLDDRVKRDNLQ